LQVASITGILSQTVIDMAENLSRNFAKKAEFVSDESPARLLFCFLSVDAATQTPTGGFCLFFVCFLLGVFFYSRAPVGKQGATAVATVHAHTRGCAGYR
jgi:hypothetical protein